MSVKTIKIKYTSESKDVILEFIKNYNNVLRFTYNRVVEGVRSTKLLTKLQHTMNHVFIDSHFLNSAIFEAKSLSKNPKLIFGGKELFLKRNAGKISKEEFKVSKLLPLCSIGESCKNSNRKFQILDEKTILFKPNRENKLIINLVNLAKNYKNDIKRLINLQMLNKIPITYKLDLDYIYLSFEDSLLNKVEVYQPKKDRVFAIDLNPNYIGWSCVDWIDSNNYSLIDAGVISIKKINDLQKNLNVSSNSKYNIYLNNKRKFEIFQVAKKLVMIAKSLKCELFSLEKLDIDSKDSGKGRGFNRLINNQWNRNALINNLNKRCDNLGIKFIKVIPNYSSILGNLLYRDEKLPDMCLSSIEIGRRGFEFTHQYIIKDKQVEKNIIFNYSEVFVNKLKQSLEELNQFFDFKNIQELSYRLKKSKVKYRFSLEESILKEFFSKIDKKSYLKLYVL